ncbi:hypothetical protein [uncultured Nonlabens sp.]|uniref:hypothetical protein n=1 Tax=uncultured Nonlabens sp. TaxID=859306 RepID=UPI0026365A2B|nr:hypothetical protein [uncultured Nonlabens sp.]
MKYILLPLVLAISFTIQAQDSDQTETSIDVQFEQLLEESNNFKEYKVIKKTEINKLRKNSNESFKKLNQKISSLEKSIITKDSRIASLENELDGINTELNNVNAEKDSMNFLGIETNKGFYNTVVWSIVGLLAFLFIFMTLRFKNSNTTTKAANKQLATTEEELEDLRRKSIEKEQKLGRQLQDERNKFAKLKGDK